VSFQALGLAREPKISELDLDAFAVIGHENITWLNISMNDRWTSPVEVRQTREALAHDIQALPV
jgi:hypothetical protein